MSIRYIALIYGIVFVLFGVAGFVPAWVSTSVPFDELATDPGAPRLVGLFPINTALNLVHIAFGIWGLAAYRSVPGARFYACAVAVIYALLAVIGFIPPLSSALTALPVYGHNVWLHGGLALIAAYFGFVPAHSAGSPAASTRARRRLPGWGRRRTANRLSRGLP